MTIGSKRIVSTTRGSRSRCRAPSITSRSLRPRRATRAGCAPAAAPRRERASRCACPAGARGPAGAGVRRRASRARRYACRRAVLPGDRPSARRTRRAAPATRRRLRGGSARRGGPRGRGRRRRCASRGGLGGRFARRRVALRARFTGTTLSAPGGGASGGFGESGRRGKTGACRGLDPASLYCGTCRRHTRADRPGDRRSSGSPRARLGAIRAGYAGAARPRRHPRRAALERRGEEVDAADRRRARACPAAASAGRPGARRAAGGRSAPGCRGSPCAVVSCDAFLQQPAQAPVVLHPVLELGVLRVGRLEVGQRGEELRVVVGVGRPLPRRRAPAAGAG